MDRQQIADRVQVDPKTVERWIAGRTPHPRYRVLVAQELGVREVDLWPDASRSRGGADLDELAGAWARRDDGNATDWRALLRGSKHQVDLIGYSLLSVIEARGALRALEDKATEDVAIRIAVADPNADHVQAADLAGRQVGRLTNRIRSAQQRLAQLALHRNIEVRQHAVATSHTILRFDDDILLTVHLYGRPGFQAPLLHLRRRSDYGIFDELAGHLDDVWRAARPLPGVTAEAPATQSAPPPQKSGADELLDRFEQQTWRPRR